MDNNSMRLSEDIYVAEFGKLSEDLQRTIPFPLFRAIFACGVSWCAAGILVELENARSGK